MTSLSTLIDRLGTLVYEPPVERLQYVDGRCLQFSKQTLDEAAAVIKANPELAREMGIDPTTGEPM